MPSSAIREMSSLLVRPDADLSHVKKLRQYATILRLGRDIEKRYPAAPDLHIVRNIMLQAAQGIAVLERTEQRRGELLELARRIAGSDAPPESRLLADLLLAQARRANAEPASPEAALAVAEFAEKYIGTKAEAKSLMSATLMAFDIGHSELLKVFQTKLRTSFAGEPGVAAFLRNRSGTFVNAGRIFEGSLALGDGRELRLPMDFIGHCILINFWSADTPHAEFKLADLKAFDRSVQGNGIVHILGVNVDPDARRAARFAKRHGLLWPHAFRARGLDDPLLLRYGNVPLPSYCVIRGDGRIVSDQLSFLGRIRGDADWRFERIMTFLRSGEFLVCEPSFKTSHRRGRRVRGERPNPVNDHDPKPDRPPSSAVSAPSAVKAVGDVPQEVLERIQACFTAPPSRYRLPESESERLYKEALRLGEEAEKRFEGAGNLVAVRNRMIVAAQGMGVLKMDPRYMERAASIARRVMESRVSPEASLLAHMALTRSELRKTVDWGAAGTSGPSAGQTDRASDILQAFTKRFTGTGVEARALAVGAVLAMEVAREELHEEWLGTLRERHGGKEHLREFLRAFQAYSLEGKSFEAEFTLLDGTKLRLPDDFRGNLAVVVFFQLGGQGQADRRSRAMHDTLRELNRLSGMLDKHKAVAAVGICLDGDRATVEASAKKQKWKWHVALGKGSQDETALRYSASHMTGRPHYLLLSREGVVLYHDRYIPPWVRRTQDIHRALLTAVQNPEALIVASTRDGRRLTDIERLWQRAQAHGRRKSWKAALADLRTLIGHAQQCLGREHLAKYRRYSAEIHETLGRIDEARVDREWALALYRIQGNWAEALKDLNKLIDFAESRQDRLRYFKARDVVLAKLGGQDKASLQPRSSKPPRSQIAQQPETGGSSRAAAPMGGMASAKTKGMILQWHVVGPFDIGPRTKPSKTRKPRPYVDLIASPKESWYFGRVLPPEKRRDPTAVYTGKAEGQAPSEVRPALTGVAEGQAPSEVRPALTGVERAEVRWEILRSDRMGVARLDYYYGPARNTAYCAVAYVHAPARGTYQMSLNSYNHVEVWVAGKPVGARRRKASQQQRQHWGQARFPAELAPGWNEVFLKVGDGSADRVRFKLQLSDPENKLRFGLHHDVHAR